MKRLTTLIATAWLTALPVSLPAAEFTVPVPDTEFLPYDQGTGPEDRNVPFLTSPRDLSLDGYFEQEVLLSGLANTYEYVDDAAQTTEVQVATSGNPYTTRMLVRHPSNPADFNGVVYMEILNATARYDGSPMWNLTFPSIIDDGAAYVGVTYSNTTAAFLKNTWGSDSFPAPSGSQPRDRSRYATLNLPTRAYTWDILLQAAALLKADDDIRNPMQGFGVDTIIATGYSQSARYVTTLSNSFYPVYGTVPGDPVIDGYIVAAGGPVSSKLNGAGFHPRGDARTFEQAYAPTVRFTTESDIGSVFVRQSQNDRPLLRTYEVAGGSHVDAPASAVGAEFSQYQFGVVGSGLGCDLPLNPIRTGLPLSAIQHRLANWIQHGILPPDDRFIEYDAANNLWFRDADGNAIGGVRPARIEVPLGTYAGANPYSGPVPSVAAILCADIIGSFDEFTQEELVDRYRYRINFLALNWWATFGQFVDGFLLPVDAPVIFQDAREVEGLPVFDWRRYRNRETGRRSAR